MRAASSPPASPRGWLNVKRWVAAGGDNGCWRVALASCCAGLSFTSSAAETTGTRPGGLTGSPLGAEGLLETVAGLFLVLATIIALAWAARRYGRFSMAGKGLVNVLGGITLGSRERVVVVQVEDTRLVLGVAPGRIETLYVLDRADDAAPPFARALETEMPESQR